MNEPPNAIPTIATLEWVHWERDGQEGHALYVNVGAVAVAVANVWGNGDRWRWKVDDGEAAEADSLEEAKSAAEAAVRAALGAERIS